MTQSFNESIEEHAARIKGMRAARQRLDVEHATRVAYCTTCQQPVPCDVRLMLDVIDSYENGITWETNCTHCAAMWDDNYSKHMQIEELKAQLDDLKAEHQ